MGASQEQGGQGGGGRGVDALMVMPGGLRRRPVLPIASAVLFIRPASVALRTRHAAATP
jgi:hypothetical protein